MPVDPKRIKVLQLTGWSLCEDAVEIHGTKEQIALMHQLAYSVQDDTLIQDMRKLLVNISATT